MKVQYYFNINQIMNIYYVLNGKERNGIYL